MKDTREETCGGTREGSILETRDVSGSRNRDEASDVSGDETESRSRVIT